MPASHAGDWGSNPHISTVLYDVIIIGGGPVGSFAAKVCSSAGLSAAVLEEHSAVGYPVQCAGLLSNSAFNECEVTEDSVQNTVSGAEIIGSCGSELSFDAGVRKAYVVDRGALDFEMAESAASCGAQYMMKTALLKINPEKRIIHTTKGDMPYKILIAADGAKSSAARSLGICKSRFIYSGIQADVKLSCDTNHVRLYPNSAPELFAWMIPTSSKTARIGLCGSKNTAQLFDEFRKKFSDTCINFVTGTLPIGIREKTYGSGCLLCGDAAGFIKPTSGGGVYTGVRSAGHAAKAALRAYEKDNFSDEMLSEYETMWKNDFGSELETGMKALLIRRRLKTDEIDSIINALNRTDVIDSIISYGDMDRPSLILKKLASNPEVLGRIGFIGAKALLRTLI